HLMMLIPIEFYRAIGVTDHLYHQFAIYAGGLAGLMVVAGAVVLLIRKMVIDRVRVHATFADFFGVISLIIVAGLGVYMTLIYNTTVVAYEIGRASCRERG